MPDVDSFQSSHAPARRRRGLSTTEIMGLMAVLISVGVGVLNGARRGRAQAGCAANLHAIRNAFEYYIGSNQDYYPAPTPTAQWEDMLREYIPRSTFCCPADNELFLSLGSSYDWRDTGNPETTLAGRPAMQVTRNSVSLAYDALPGWHAPRMLQVLRVGGDIELMNDRDFFLELQRPPGKP